MTNWANKKYNAVSCSLPSWAESKREYENGRANALEVFIYHNEPADDKKWRRELAEAVHYVENMGDSES